MSVTTKQLPTEFTCDECGAAVVLDIQTRKSAQRSWDRRVHVCTEDAWHEIGEKTARD